MGSLCESLTFSKTAPRSRGESNGPLLRERWPSAAAARAKGGRRLYAAYHLKRLVFHSSQPRAGFTAEEIRNLLGLGEGGYTCGKVQKVAVDHLGIIRRKIIDLCRMERALAETAVVRALQPPLVPYRCFRAENSRSKGQNWAPAACAK